MKTLTISFALLWGCLFLFESPVIQAGEDHRLTNMEAVIQATIDQAVADDRVPGAIAMLARGNSIEYLGKAGLMGPETPMREDVIFPLASVGKMYTATAAMILIERGALALDDPVSRFIPTFVTDRQLTVRHLLTHTSGLTVDGSAYWDVWNQHAGETTTLDFAVALASLPRVSSPGETFEYGGTGGAYEVLGAVIEVASGQTLEAFMQAAIFEPLGLDDTYFFVPPNKEHRLPAFYEPDNGGWKISREMGVEWPRNAYFFGGGGVSSSVEDILTFSQIFLHRGEVNGKRILRPETVDQMMSDQLGDRRPANRSISWGYGASVPAGATPDNVSLYGWVGGNYTALVIHRPTQTVFWTAFPIEPPGDSALLGELRAVVLREIMTAE